MSKSLRNLVLVVMIVGISGTLFVTSGGAKPAEKSYKASDPLPPAAPQAQREAAVKAAEVKDPASRVKELEEKIRSDSPDAAALSELGKIYLQQRNYPRATDLYSAALELSPKDNDLRNGYATALLFQGMVGMAEREFRKVVESDPENPEWYLNLAIVLSHKNPPNIDEAVKAWQKVVELDPTGDLAEKAKGYLERYQRP